MDPQIKNEWFMPVALRGAASAESNWGQWRIAGIRMKTILWSSAKSANSA
jgi:hypothetical protein